MPPEMPQDRDQLHQPLAHDRDDGQQQQQSRERHPGIDEPLHHQVQPAAEKSRGAADQHGDQNVERGGCQTHRQGNPGVVDDAAQEVAPQVVGTERIRGSRTA